MSFFQNIDTTQQNFEIGGSFELLPKDTRFLAAIESATNRTFDNGDRVIEIKWRISKPEQYANRLVFQKLKVYDNDADKVNKAKNMLSAIAVNAGGKLFSEMQARNEQEPSDQSLASMTMRPMVILLDVWKMTVNGEEKTGNFVKQVSPINQQVQSAQAPVQAPPAAQAPVTATIQDNDIPF